MYQAAATASEATPGEALFPVSMLTNCTLRSGGSQLGSCVDAMAGARTGRLAYVVVSHGGIGGAGETMRKLAWRDIHVEQDEVCTSLTERQFHALEPIPRDEWPAA